MKRAKDKESTATVDGSKVKEEKLEVAGGKCWRGFWLSVLNVTGEIFSNKFLMPCCNGCSADDDHDDFDRIFFLALKWLFWCKNTKKVQKVKFSRACEHIFGAGQFNILAVFDDFRPSNGPLGQPQRFGSTFITS